MSEIPDFEEGETYQLDHLPENVMNKSGKLEWIDDNTLALEDGQLIECEWSHVRVTDVKYVTEDGELLEEPPGDSDE